MAGKGKKREKFHTHRAGKLDQENLLYTPGRHMCTNHLIPYSPAFWSMLHCTKSEMWSMLQMTIP